MDNDEFMLWIKELKGRKRKRKIKWEKGERKEEREKVKWRKDRNIE